MTNEETEVDAEQKRERLKILELCSRYGYGRVIDEAARLWAKKPDMGMKGMANWLRSEADQIDPPTQTKNGDSRDGGVGEAQPNECATANALELIEITELLREAGNICLSRREAIRNLISRNAELREGNKAMFDAAQRLRDRNLNAYGEAERDIILYIATHPPAALLETTAKAMLELTEAIGYGEHRPPTTDETTTP